MGLDTSHNCWHGAYSAFMKWRREIARVAGLPPLDLMEGFYGPLAGGHRNLPTLYHGRTSGCEYLVEIDALLPIKWDCLKPSALHTLLHHSDCDGAIESKDCGPIADELEKLIPMLPAGDAGGHIGFWRDKTQQFINGLRAASAAGENVEFH